MAKKSDIDLYQSKATIPSMRRTAPQIHPGVARMYTGKGAEQVGDAIMEVAQKMHQVNVTRQVTAALAEYKMKATEFILRMQNSDPSKVNFEDEYKKFMASQSGLASGVSRDASNIISNKMTEYGASTFAELKKIEIRNMRGMVLAEAPEVLEGLVNDCAKNPARCADAKQEWNNYLNGVSPALRPYEVAKLKNAWDEAEQEAVRGYQENQIYAQINAGNTEGAKQMIEGSNLSEKKKRTLNNASEAQKTKVEKKSLLQRDMAREEQSTQILESLGTGTMEPISDNLGEVEEIANIVYQKAAGDTLDMEQVDLPPEYYSIKDKVEKMTHVDDYTFLKALMTTPLSKIQELREQNQENASLRKYKATLVSDVELINKGFDKLIATIYTYDFNDDTNTTLLREIEEERELTIADTKQKYKNGEKAAQIRKSIRDVFEDTKKGVIERGGLRWLKPKIREFHGDLQYPTGTPEEMERKRFRGIINLLSSEGKYQREVEAAVEAGWFSEREELPIRPKRVRAPQMKTEPETTTNYIPFAEEDKYFAAPIQEGQSESDAILDSIATGRVKEFKTAEEVEKFTGKKVR